MNLISNSPSGSASSSVPPGIVRMKSLVRANTLYQNIIGKVHRQRSSDCDSFLSSDQSFRFQERSGQIASLENLMSFGLGSGPYGEPIRHIEASPLIFLLQCRLVKVSHSKHTLLIHSSWGRFKYCSERCQKQHWPRHSSICAHPYLEESWQPGWVMQDRPPSFASSSATYSPSASIFPAFDNMSLAQNEFGELAVTDKDFKICFAACADIRNLIETVNNLPSDYGGTFDVLLNNPDPITTNRNLIILYALLNPEPSIDEAAELAIHLMYSAVLSAPCAAFLQRSLDDIYRSTQSDGDNGIDISSFRVGLNTRGRGKIYSFQTIAGIKPPLEVFTSTTYSLNTALQDRSRILGAPENVDSWDRFLSRLRPSHRMAFQCFRETGVLAPFSVDTNRFTHPNRLMFSSQGQWLFRADILNPFQGWDSTSVQLSGAKYSMVDSADIFGCLFFHLKSQFHRFASQVKDLHINFVLTQFDPRILAKGIMDGVIPIFEGGCFDRIDTRDMMDEIGIGECLREWGPLLNRENPHASLLMHSRAKCFEIPSLSIKLKDVFVQGLRSPALLRLIESLDAFYDHDHFFHEFLSTENTDSIAAALDLQLRPQHRIHSRRFGVPLDAHAHSLPDLSRSRFYDLVSLCEVDFSTRFLEFGWRH
ncbi:hypothetical protein EV360DRAFT_94465 [Lentinula raphanica]|nr:hypothetical protein EV360DRAFT_94465 [Lentinula raphanica]